MTILLAALAVAAPYYSITIPIPPAKPYQGHRPKGKLAIEQIRYPLAATIWGEARNQPEGGRRAVGHVIMNRIAADTNRYGHGLRGVTWKRKQFSCWNLGDANRDAFIQMLKLPDDHPDRVAWADIRTLARKIYYGHDADNTGGATYYHTTAIKAYWRNDMTVVGIMYDHIFYRPKTGREWALYRRDMSANKRLPSHGRGGRHGDRRN